MDPSTIVQITPKQPSSQEAPKRKSPPSKTIPASPPSATSESQDQDPTLTCPTVYSVWTTSQSNTKTIYLGFDGEWCSGQEVT